MLTLALFILGVVLGFQLDRRYPRQPVLTTGTSTVGATLPVTQRMVVVPRRICRVREVQYEDGTIDAAHSACHGPRDIDLMVTEDARIVKDTAHDWPVN